MQVRSFEKIRKTGRSGDAAQEYRGPRIEW